MNRYVKKFLTRGTAFAGLGPVIVGVVYFILSRTIENFSLDGGEVFAAIVSTYLLAFVQAGASVFDQIEHWSPAKSLLCHFSTIYLAYITCYLANVWIPLDLRVILIFTVVFIGVYMVVWLSVYLSVRQVQKKFNRQIQ